MPNFKMELKIIKHTLFKVWHFEISNRESEYQGEDIRWEYILIFLFFRHRDAHRETKEKPKFLLNGVLICDSAWRDVYGVKYRR